jgi:hypothetical protein
MAKFKAATGKKKAGKKSIANAIPCLVLIIVGFSVIMLLFYFGLKSGS